ncbi:MAG TPA: hypothetical protein PLD55_07745 [bacterium]|nr:hypothetical protein [bacterium]MDX9806266.1 hypothetical protein [bacterium]HPA56273.1 hypothetical protein [bacterium]HPG36710.1 hypothetical protein [bacterium]HPM47101.1 hypothetical protein [bacterium]
MKICKRFQISLIYASIKDKGNYVDKYNCKRGRKKNLVRKRENVGIFTDERKKKKGKYNSKYEKEPDYKIIV